MINLALSFKSLSILRVILLDSWSISASYVILKYARQRVWGFFCLFFMMDRTSVLEYVCLFSGALALRFIAWIKAGLMDWICYWHVCQQYSFHNNTGWQFTIKKHVLVGSFLRVVCLHSNIHLKHHHRASMLPVCQKHYSLATTAKSKIWWKHFL